MTNLVTRVLSALVLIPVAVAAVYAGGLGLTLLLSVFAGAGAWELYRIARAAGVAPFEAIGIPVAAALPLATLATLGGWLERPLAAAAVVFVTIIGLAVFARTPTERPLESIAVTVFGALYTGGTLSCALALRHHQWVVTDLAGSALVFFPVLVTWGVDIGAYVVGRWVGGRKLHPTVSPGKTVAGAVGGTVVAVAAALAYNAYVLPRVAQLALPLVLAIVFALVVSLAAQVGDLAESLFKREAGVKDSSQIIPGHGGVLDRLDSLYFVLPVGWLLLSRLLVQARP